jgi:hypothetical protein
MINAQKLNLETYKSKIDDSLNSNGIVFDSKENINEAGETYFIYMLESEKIGIITFGDGRFSGVVSDNGRINCAEKEGFDDQDISENHPIWIDCPTIEKFLENFIPKKYED